MRVLVLVDGEHYPPVTRWGMQVVRDMGHDILAALFLGGTEKVRSEGPPDLGVPLVNAGSQPPHELGRTIDRFGPEAVVDLSDEPLAGYQERMELAAVALARGVPYLGPDFRFDPPISGPPLEVPTVAVIGTGKRTGKTAIAGEVARAAARQHLNPVLVAMGRGGPPEPQMAEPGSVDLDLLLELVRRGEHAASDYLEDAVTTGVATIGARRAGGGLAGGPLVTNVREAAELAVKREPGLVILEGSGAAIPPVPWDVGILVVPATIPPEYLGGYLGPFRLLLSDVVVLTMAGSPTAGPENLLALRSHVQRLRGDARVLVTDFEPVPLRDVRGRRVFFSTTAPEAIAARQARSLEASWGCRVVSWSTRLADREGLARELDQAEAYDVLLTELKAAAVDVACERALGRGAEVVFVDNRPVPVGDEGHLADELTRAFDLAMERHEAR